MNRLLPLTGILLLTTSLAGCVIAIGSGDFDADEEWQKRQERNSEYVRRLNLGQSMASIEADLGEADFVESFRRDGAEFEVLFYRTRLMNDDGNTAKDETTPLVFVDSELVGWGESAIDKATR